MQLYGGLSGVPSRLTIAEYRAKSRKYANRHKKAAQHATNVAERRALNQAADKSEGKNPRPKPNK